jgi:hypothetical protein
LGTQLADVRRYASLHQSGSLLLQLLCERGGGPVAIAAVRAGALALWAGDAASADAQVFRGASLRWLRTAAAVHDRAPCGDGACVRCTEQRSRGERCGLPGCGATRRAADAAKKLQKCAACRAFAYCGAEHQRDDWARHKAECAVLKRQLADAA